MFRCVALARTDVSEECSASIIRVTRICELGMLAVSIKLRTLQRNSSLVTLMMEALGSSETTVLTRTTGRNIPEDGILHSHCLEHIISY
jgi:hypothetical protein